MGKEARMRKERSRKSLIKWASENPERFEQEWSKRLDSWAGLIWASSKDRVFFTKEDYEKLLIKYPIAKAVLESIAVRLYNRIGDFIGVHIYLDTLNNFKEELGSEVLSEILSHVEMGTLIGDCIFSIVDHAKKTLMECGEKAVTLQLQETTELLNNECCQALASNIGNVIYTVGQGKDFERAELFGRKRRKK